MWVCWWQRRGLHHKRDPLHGYHHPIYSILADKCATGVFAPPTHTPPTIITGMTCLHWCAEEGRTDIARGLLVIPSVLEAINVPDAYGRSPALVAASNHHKETAEFLVSKGSKLKLKRAESGYVG